MIKTSYHHLQSLKIETKIEKKSLINSITGFDYKGQYKMKYMSFALSFSLIFTDLCTIQSLALESQTDTINTSLFAME